MVKTVFPLSFHLIFVSAFGFLFLRVPIDCFTLSNLQLKTHSECTEAIMLYTARVLHYVLYTVLAKFIKSEPPGSKRQSLQLGHNACMLIGIQLCALPQSYYA